MYAIDNSKVARNNEPNWNNVFIFVIAAFAALYIYFSYRFK